MDVNHEWAAAAAAGLRGVGEGSIPEADDAAAMNEGICEDFCRWTGVGDDE